MSGRNKNISERRVSMTPDHLKKQIFLEREFYVSRQRGILKSNSCKCCTLTAIYPLLRAASLEILSITDCIVSFQDTTTGTDPPKIHRHVTCCKKQWSRFHRAFLIFMYFCLCYTRDRNWLYFALCCYGFCFCVQIHHTEIHILDRYLWLMTMQLKCALPSTRKFSKSLRATI